MSRWSPITSGIYRDWLAFAFLEKVSDPNGAKHPKGRSGHWGSAHWGSDTFSAISIVLRYDTRRFIDRLRCCET